MLTAIPFLQQDFELFDDDIIIIQLIVQGVLFFVFGTVCAVIAPGRGRSGVGWFFIGAFFNCLGLIVLLLIPNLKEEAAKQTRRDAETRRLREQLKKERHVADQRHDAHNQRLGSHDRALGVDTSPRPAALPGSASPPPPPADEAEWFFAVGGKQEGPVSGSELRRLWLDEDIPDATMVWRDGMADWVPIGQVGDVLGG